MIQLKIAHLALNSNHLLTHRWKLNREVISRIMGNKFFVINRMFMLLNCYAITTPDVLCSTLLYTVQQEVLLVFYFDIYNNLV
jgi:hypothetical protein